MGRALEHERRPRSRLRRRMLGVTVGAAALAVVAAGCGGSSGSSSSSASGGTKVAGGTAVLAEPPSTTPNYIFPFTSSSYFSVVNSEDFQYLHVPAAVLVRQRRVPDAEHQPVARQRAGYNGNNVTITLKGWKWSNGETVTAAERGVLDPHAAGGRLHRLGRVRARRVPDQRVTNVKATNPTDDDHDDEQGLQPDLVHLQRAQPDHPDAAGLGPHGERAEPLHHHGSPTAPRSTPTWTASPRTCQLGVLAALAIVDGPWKLTRFNSDGNSTFVPNHSYSGSPKPKLAEFQEVPFTTEAAEYNVLQAAPERQQPEDRRRATCRPPTRRPSRPTPPSAPTRSTTSPSTRCTRGASTTSR